MEESTTVASLVLISYLILEVLDACEYKWWMYESDPIVEVSPRSIQVNQRHLEEIV